MMKHTSLFALSFALTSACALTPDSGNASPQATAPIEAAKNNSNVAQNSTQEAVSMALLTPERLAGSPSLNGPSPNAVKFSPDGTKLTFLQAREDDKQRQDLWAYDVASGKASLLVDSTLLEPEGFELSEEEKALRERKRIAGTTGIVSYSWDTKGEQILIPIGGDLYIVKLNEDGPQVTQLTATESFEYNAEISPNGGQVSFIRDGALYAIDLASGDETQISPSADPANAITYGVAEFVAQEEMSRYVGTWWSPDDAHVVYTRVDESPVAIILRFDISASDVTVIEQRYPRAGEPNAIVDLFVKNRATGKTVQVNLDASPDTYLARVNWAGPNTLFVQRVNRDQTRIELLRVDPKTGDTSIAYVEEQPNWINLSFDFRALSDGRFLWSTEESGYRHITLHNSDGSKVTQITSGEWVVDAIQAVDETNGYVYFTANKDTPLETSLYRASYKDTDAAITRITEAGGQWSINMASDAQSYVGTFQSPTTPPQTALYKADGERIAWVEENKLDDTHPYAAYLDAHVTPEYGTLTAADGQILHYSITKPHDFDPSKSYPAIVEVYGGPHVQRVSKKWLLSDVMTAQRGYVVFRLDNRGTFNRGKKFEDVIFRHTGEVEVIDQLQGVEHLKSLPYIDANRIGLNGWSYGGYMALMTTLKAPEGTFAASVSGAPVSDWALYDTFYTERYMDTPQDNSEGYELSSVFPHLKNLNSPMLMIHGMADDNVTFDNSTRVYAELQKLRKPFEMMTYPGERHGVRDTDMSIHLMNTRLAFFDRYLKPRE
ncbi:DPP IV N-terminal domain-containing protein [Hirschia litorea]|uniref:DPP IV N-terminal domain-containing protein n=1 Tax=Hirschia litorea TaxID=1199156 RepID=A0ABW2ILC9_9PROT